MGGGEKMLVEAVLSLCVRERRGERGGEKMRGLHVRARERERLIKRKGAKKER